VWRWDREDPGVLSASVGGEVERRLERLGLHVRSIQEDGEDQRAWDYTSGEIEQAPPDVDSASKWQNRKIGLTVKDMTYEIRHALSLKDADPGVLVAKVEDGSPMTVARIYPNEIITRLDDQPLGSAKQMRELIAKASKAGRQKVRLTVLRLGKTRFADLAVTEYDPADDEAIDEPE